MELSWKLRPSAGATSDPNIPSFLDCDLLGMDGKPLVGKCSTTTSTACRIDENCPAGELCIASDVADIELDWRVNAVAGHATFRCSDGNGRTAFELPTGTATITIAPRCPGDTPADPSTYAAPAPVQRTVVQGQTISIGAVELIIDVAGCTQQPCICQ